MTEESLCWQEGLDEWRPLRSFPELAAIVREAFSLGALVDDATAAGRAIELRPPPRSGAVRRGRPAPPAGAPPRPARRAAAVSAPPAPAARSNVVPDHFAPRHRREARRATDDLTRPFTGSPIRAPFSPGTRIEPVGRPGSLRVAAPRCRRRGRLAPSAPRSDALRPGARCSQSPSPSLSPLAGRRLRAREGAPVDGDRDGRRRVGVRRHGGHRALRAAARPHPRPSSSRFPARRPRIADDQRRPPSRRPPTDRHAGSRRPTTSRATAEGSDRDGRPAEARRRSATPRRPRRPHGPARSARLTGTAVAPTDDPGGGDAPKAPGQCFSEGQVHAGHRPAPVGHPPRVLGAQHPTTKPTVNVIVSLTIGADGSGAGRLGVGRRALRRQVHRERRAQLALPAMGCSQQTSFPFHFVRQ